MSSLRSTRDVPGPSSMPAATVSKSTQSFSLTKNLMRQWSDRAIGEIQIATRQKFPYDDPSQSLNVTDSNRLQKAFATVNDALDDLQAAHLDVANWTVGNAFPDQSRQWVANKCMDRAQSAADTAINALLALRTLGLEISAELTVDPLPKRPAGVDSITAADRKSDICDVLSSERVLLLANNDLGTAFGQRLSRAVDERDELTIYVMTTQMGVWLEARGVQQSTINEKIASALARTNPGVPTPVQVSAAKLAALLGSGGVGTLQSFCVQAAYAVRAEVEGMPTWINNVCGVGINQAITTLSAT